MFGGEVGFLSFVIDVLGGKIEFHLLFVTMCYYFLRFFKYSSS